MPSAKQELDPILQTLLKDSSVKTLRKSLEDLGRSIGDSIFRQRLANESGGNSCSLVTKRHALSLLWQNILSVSMRAIKVLMRSNKPQSLEYIQFSKILSCFAPSEVMEQDIRPRLSLEMLGKVRVFAFSLFLNETSVAAFETDLFKILLSVCSRSDFVGTFRPDDFDDLMDILEPRIDVELSIENNCTFETVEVAAKTLEALITTTYFVGISMHDHIAECIMWIARRCKACFQSATGRNANTTAQASFTLIRTATLFLKNEPDLSIGPLSIYGSSILGTVRRLYGISNRSEKDVIVDFLSAYM
jgi:hypothetical protein